jgi:formate dehydrogenase (coenzyme F420) beta subunit
MDKLRAKAKELLTAGTVQVVVGYEKGTGGRIRPAFITDAEKADKLVYNSDCHHNLALYLYKKETKHLGKIAVVAPPFVLRSILILTTEFQIAEDSLVVLGVTPEQEMIEFANFKEIETWVNQHPIEVKPKDQQILDKLAAMSREDRWAYWQNEFSKCIKCFACRGACPMCSCFRCTVDYNGAQWIPVASHQLGNFDWHSMRAMHLAGRCSVCGQCGEACPMDIPVHLLSFQLNEDVFKMFGVRAGLTLKKESLLSTYQPNDRENFIR